MKKDIASIVVLIPAYKPDNELIRLVEDLKTQGFLDVVVVDDGGGEAFAHIFAALKEKGCSVLTHAINMGKGKALKTGINYILTDLPNAAGVVTADADGQHLIPDIMRVAQALFKHENTLVLGSRKFKSKVPFKSRFGNTITKSVFNYVSGQRIRDTQTGLRSIPMSALKRMLALKGDRYEYEMKMLLEAGNMGLKLTEIDIETVYIDDNSGSHFNPIKDSWRIYKLIILFAGSSMFAALIDFLLFTLLTVLIGSSPSVLWIPVAGARVISSLVNFTINRNWIFAKRDEGKLGRHLLGYYALAVVIMALNYWLITTFAGAGVNVYIAKIITELLFFIVSFLVQKRLIFK